MGRRIAAIACRFCDITGILQDLPGVEFTLIAPGELPERDLNGFDSAVSAL